jgi:hypothetical protein
MAARVNKKAMPCNSPKRTPSHPKKSHIVKACSGQKEKVIRFGEQGAKTAGKPKAGEQYEILTYSSLCTLYLCDASNRTST